MLAVWITILGGFAVLIETTMAQPDFNEEIVEMRDKIKEEREFRSFQTIVYDKMENVDGYYIPVRDTTYILEDHQN
jgi:hypothetical protein